MMNTTGGTTGPPVNMNITSTELENLMLCKKCSDVWIDVYMAPRQTVNRLEGYVILMAVFLLILLVLGPWRSRSHNWLIQYGVKGAYMLSFPLLSYTVGVTQGVVHNELYAVWASFLVLLFGGANSVSVQKLDENKQWIKPVFYNVMYVTYIGSVAATLQGQNIFNSARALAILVFLISLKNGERISALMLAGDPRRSGTRTVALYMKHYEPVLSTGRHDPCSMQGYNYLVLPFVVKHLRARPSRLQSQLVRDHVITLEKIWRHDNGVLSIDDPAIRHMKDVCLSFALFRLAVRRYFGYGCTDSGPDKARDLVLQGLLAQDCERAFQVIQVELAFVYDFFFSRYAAIMRFGEIWSTAISLLTTTFIVSMGTYVLTHPNKDDNFWEFGLVKTEKQDIIVTKVILCALAMIEMLQIWLYFTSDWAKVSLVCKYIQKPSWQGNKYIEMLLWFMGQVSVFLEHHKWFRCCNSSKIGQYSFMDSFNHPGHRFLENMDLIPMFRKGRKEGQSIPVPMEVKKAIAQTLKGSNGQISNGASALERHDMTELYWACQTNSEFTLAHVILLWHMATSYCENNSESNLTDIQANRLVATSLSKYCAYLVAFVPELVPGNPLETETTLDELVLEAREAFPARQDSRYRRLGQLKNQGRDDWLLAKGEKLGMELARMMEDKRARWKLLADFWVELMLYIAPSDNVAGHIESLAQGGEFVTHVWALLMHAGILERPAAA